VQQEPAASPSMEGAPFIPSVAQVSGCPAPVLLLLNSGLMHHYVATSSFSPATCFKLWAVDSTLTAVPPLPLLQVSFCMVYLWVLGLYIYSILLKRSR
jgi:hypothetical protein